VTVAARWTELWALSLGVERGRGGGMEKRRQYILSIPSNPSRFLHVPDGCGIILPSSFSVGLARCYLWRSAASLPWTRPLCVPRVWWQGAAQSRREEEERIRNDIGRMKSRPPAAHSWRAVSPAYLFERRPANGGLHCGSSSRDTGAAPWWASRSGRDSAQNRRSKRQR
jgi:hypothetical protein